MRAFISHKHVTLVNQTFRRVYSEWQWLSRLTEGSCSKVTCLGSSELEISGTGLGTFPIYYVQVCLHSPHPTRSFLTFVILIILNVSGEAKISQLDAFRRSHQYISDSNIPADNKLSWSCPPLGCWLDLGQET